MLLKSAFAVVQILIEIFAWASDMKNRRSSEFEFSDLEESF